MPTGIRKRGASYEASVYLKREGRKLRRTFPTLAAAKAWRAEAVTAANKGGLRAPQPTTLREAWEDWYEGARAGAIRNRSGDRYKPSSLRDYERNMRLRLLPELGAVRLSELRRPDLQELADGLLAAGLDPSTIRSTFLPLRADLPPRGGEGGGRGEPVHRTLAAGRAGATRALRFPQEAERLIAAVPEQDRGVWATAMYAGLRRGELRALRVEALDLAAGVIRVERGYDAVEGEIGLKSGAGRRKVPIPAVLRDYLSEHLARSGRVGSDRCFGSTAESPFDGQKLQARADKAWREAGLERITPHECRAHVRLADDRGGSEREGPSGLHGALQHHDHARHLRSPDAGFRGRGREPAERLP